MEAHHAQTAATQRPACFGGNGVSETRKLAAILVADIVGYSRLAGADEDRTLARLRGLRSDLIDPAIAAHHGRIVKRTGDGSLIEFRSVRRRASCPFVGLRSAWAIILKRPHDKPPPLAGRAKPLPRIESGRGFFDSLSCALRAGGPEDRKVFMRHARAHCKALQDRPLGRGQAFPALPP
jgi:class 3 adenylate cyclase